LRGIIHFRTGRRVEGNDNLPLLLITPSATLGTSLSAGREGEVDKNPLLLALYERERVGKGAGFLR
jgi:hypothetical protein